MAQVALSNLVCCSNALEQGTILSLTCQTCCGPHVENCQHLLLMMLIAANMSNAQVGGQL